MDGQVREIQSQLCRIRSDRVDLDKERQLLLEDQCKLRGLIAFQTPATATATGPGDLESLRIQVRLQVLERKRTRLANQEADLRRQERSLSLQLGPPLRGQLDLHLVCGTVFCIRPEGDPEAGKDDRKVEERTTKLSSSEPGHTNTDLSQFEALTLNIAPPTAESADRLVEHPTEVRSSERGGTSVDLSKVEGLSLNVSSAESTDGAVAHAGDLDSSAPDSTNAKQPAVREGLSPRSQERWLRIDKYLAEHTFDDMWEGMVAMKNGFCNPPKKVPFPKKKSSKKLASPDSLQSPHGLDAQSFQTTTQCGESTKQIIENGKQWMKKEVMEAFKKYMKETGRFRGVEFELDKLLHQCLSVETYEKIFHHYNFTVKMKQAGSDKWSSTLYFAQVKEMYGQKYYFCYPLDPFEDGFCHACKNQGMDALKHPAVPIGYETGQAGTGCPFFEDDSDDDGDRVPDDDGMAWAFSQVFFGGAPY
ncbi:hypothetical protein ACQ4PT_010902 [Festuca glaucescens]